MRAVVLDDDGLPELADVPEPTGPGLLVRVLACGLCGSDVEKLGNAPGGSVLGHEVAGVLENGARVTVMHRVPCGVCERCLAGHQSTCGEFRELRISPGGTVLGHEVAGELEDGSRVTVMHRVPCGVCERCLAGHQSTCGEFRELRISPGGFAERLLATHCVPLPDTLDELGGVWVEPLACVLRAAEAVPRGRVLVVGCGAIGQLWVQVLRRRGDDVVALDPRAERRHAAHLLGAELDDGPVTAAVLTAHGGVNDALARLEPGGTLLVFAAPGDLVPVALEAVYRKELHVVGSRSATPAYFRAAAELLPVLVTPEVTVLPLERFVHGVELYRRGRATKVVFTP